MSTGRSGKGASGGGDAVAKILSVLVVLVAAAAAIALLPRKAPEHLPPDGRELLGLVGSPIGRATAALARRRVHPAHNGASEFYYASPDGCHGHLRISLVTFGGMVVGWVRGAEEPARRCMAGPAPA